MDNKIIQLLASVVSSVAQGKEYKSWSNEFKLKETHEVLDIIQNELKNYDFESMIREELISLGFGPWDEKLILVPLYILPSLKKGTKLKCIDDSIVTVGKDKLDNDTRFGCIPYEFIKSK